MKRLSLLLVLVLAVPVSAEDIQTYIRHTWGALTRSVLRAEAYEDVKVKTRSALYLPSGMAVPSEVRVLQQHGIAVLHLPRPIHKLGDVQPSELPRPGLLYLPHPYVVPGGMFNEMYGWDSYFIVRGLLHDGHMALARGMVENYLFEVEHYGAILNANRSYYLTRSQPPFLTSAARAVYDAEHLDKAWLEHAYALARQDYRMWTSAPNLARDTGLSRYWDVGDGPVPEMKADDGYYARVADWELLHRGSEYIQSLPNHTPRLDMVLHMRQATVSDGLFLTEDYYKGDRAMRASGYDVSFRFGPFSGATHHYAPVCLNSLLYKTETDLAWMADTLGHADEAATWRQAAERRRTLVDRYLWNAQAGMYFDYDAEAGRQSTYHYATTFFPLWAGLASPEQATAVESHLAFFEQRGGLAMSDVDSGAQWDKPFGWAPVNLLAVEGLWQAGDHADAARIAREWDATVLHNFEREHTIHEKYNVVTGSSAVHIKVGYSQNVLGFGWTNAVYLELLKYEKP